MVNDRFYELKFIKTSLVVRYLLLFARSYMMSIRELSKELQEVAIKELNEDPARISEDLAHIKEWLSKQPHISARTGDQFLLAFLRGSKFSLERTKEKLDLYYTYKTLLPEIYANRDPMRPEIQKVLSFGTAIPLPKLSHATSPRYCLGRYNLVTEHQLDNLASMKVLTMIQNILMLEDDNMNVAGVCTFHDLRNCKFEDVMAQLNVQKRFIYFYRGFSNRIKGNYYFNVNSTVETIKYIVYPLLSEKIKRRLAIYGSLEELKQHVPIDILPEEYGGQGGKIDELVAHWKSKVESYRDWFLEDEQYKTDETKRQGNPRTSENMFGVEGSFRQLSVD